MSEKLAYDDGLTRLASYLAANAYTSGNSGTFAVATDADLETVLTTGESTDWNDKASVVKAIGYRTGYPNPVHGICNDVHVPGNSRIFEYMVNTHDFNFGQNGAVSQTSGGCFVPYFLDAINKQIYKDNDYAKVTENLKAAGTTIDASNFDTYYPKLRNAGYFFYLFGSCSAYIDYLGGAS